MYDIEERDSDRPKTAEPTRAELRRDRVLDELGTFTEHDFEYVLGRAMNRRMGGAAIAKDGQTSEAAASAPVRGVTLANVERVFSYQAWDGRQIGQAEPVKEAIIHLAKTILRNVPDCPDRSVAIRKLRELRMDINSAITHRGEF